MAAAAPTTAAATTAAAATAAAVKTVRKPRFPKCGRDAENLREDIGKQKGRGFNLCVAPSPRNQVSRISDGAEKVLE